MSQFTAHEVELFALNFFKISYKYQLSDRDWYNNSEHLLGKVQMKFSELTASSVVESRNVQFEITVSFVIP